MVIIPRSLARRLRIVFSRGLGISPRNSMPDVQFRADQRGLSIGIVGDKAEITYQLSAQCSVTPFSVPFELLKRCEGAKDEPVTIDRQHDEIVARWTDAAIPQSARFPAGECEESLPLPDTMQPNDSEALLAALRDAVETTDRGASRYVLNCIRLRGSDGQIAGTDGRQLFVQDGFSFPWEDELIIPASRVFTCPDIRVGSSVEIGSTDEWVVIRSGHWTIRLRIEKEGRFPRIDECVPSPSRTQSTLRLSGSDAAFLRKALRRIPSSDDLNSPVTVELNGSVTIRAKGDDQSTPTEVVLTGSRRDGDVLRFNTNRDFLSRVIRLGFRDMEFSGAESPACCRSGRRVYVWSLLSKEAAILSDPDAVRIESPVVSSRANEPRQRAKRQCTCNHEPVAACDRPALGTSGTLDIAQLIEEAETLKASLCDVLNQTDAVITSLKQQRRHETAEVSVSDSPRSPHQHAA